MLTTGQIYTLMSSSRSDVASTTLAEARGGHEGASRRKEELLNSSSCRLWSPGDLGGAGGDAEPEPSIVPFSTSCPITTTD